MSGYTDAQRLKFELLASGAVVSPAAADVLSQVVRDGVISPADYASTSGIIVRLDGTEWVNVPVEKHNPNFVAQSPFTFDCGRDGFFVHGAGLSARAEFWPLPEYHGSAIPNGRPLNNYVFTHGDRARLSPTIGCAMECTFCNIPYDDAYAGVKPVEAMLDALRVALADPVQPARHLLISGGTPGPPHVAALREVYERVLTAFSHLDVDIMMVPVEGLFDLPRLNQLGVNELSVNLELWGDELARTAMRHKHRAGRNHYLAFLEEAAAELGGHRVRSMLMVGIEPLADTLAGVRAIAERGCTPVLSPFRPDPVTPMASHRPPTAELLREAYERTGEIAARHDVVLGPGCAPCTHNTLNFAAPHRNTGFPRLEPGLPSL